MQYLQAMDSVPNHLLGVQRHHLQPAAHGTGVLFGVVLGRTSADE
jgi:hypothetical protein